MLFNMTGGGGKKGLQFFPLFSGLSNVVVSEDGSSGYIECMSSGVLSWLLNKKPAETVDVTCIGGGGGGNSGKSYSSEIYSAGAGGGGGYVDSAYDIVLDDVVEITVGAGGGYGATGGTSSFGDSVSAAGGTGSQHYGSYAGNAAGSGGNAGGVGRVQFNSLTYNAAAGCSNGAAPAAVSQPAYQQIGTSQGTPTTDILGRKHAGGGGGGNTTNVTAKAGGVSDCINGSGTSAGMSSGCGGGGGGYGGGGGGANSAGAGAGVGGDGAVIIGWGDYLALYEAQNA